MSTYVLVHGGRLDSETWNALVGREDIPPGVQLAGRVWNRVTPILEARGHAVLAPDLPDERTSDLTGHIGHVSDIIAKNGIEWPILVGHSYGGMVITGLAARLNGQVERLFYVDAALPNPGESLFDVIAASGEEPLSFPDLEPAAAYVEKLDFDPLALAGLKKTYITCTQSSFSCVTSTVRERIADLTCWDFRELPTSHFAMATMPGQLTALLQSG